MQAREVMMATSGDERAIAADLRRVRDAVYDAGKATGADGRTFDIWPVGLTRAAGEFLLEVVRAEKAVRTIETGLAYGLSTTILLEGVLENIAASRTKAEGCVHVAVDPFQARDWGDSGLRLLREAGAEGLVRFIARDSSLALPGLVEEGARFDLGFVDGGHTFELAFMDIYFMQRMVRPGGVIVVDDVWMPSVRTAADFFVRNMGFTCSAAPAESAGKRFAVLRAPEVAPVRAWDHFVRFGGDGGEEGRRSASA